MTIREDFPFLLRLGLREDADERAIRRAYARELKQIDQESDAVGFQQLREAYETALQWARWKAEHEVQQEVQPAPLQPDPSAASENAGSRAENGVENGTQNAPPDATVGNSDPVPATALDELYAPLDAIEPTAASPAQQSAQQPAQEPAEALADTAADTFDPYELSGQAFARCLECMHAAFAQAKGPDKLLASEALKQVLDTPELFNITLRDFFEWRVASHLAEGWRPGNEALLVAATEVFDWAKDARRLARFGEPGHLLNRAIDEREMYDRQTGKEMQEQRELIARLRDPARPGASELVRKATVLETVALRFPTWLALITDMENLRRWREWEKEVPGWRRKLVFRRKAPGEKNPQPVSESSWGLPRWGWIMLFIVITNGARLLSGLSSHPEQPVSPPSIHPGVSIPADYATFNRNPEQPPQSILNGEQGRVILRVLVKADGSPAMVEIGESSGFPMLDSAAREAVQSWRFQPANINGTSIAQWYDLPITFKPNSRGLAAGAVPEAASAIASAPPRPVPPPISAKEIARAVNAKRGTEKCEKLAALAYDYGIGTPQPDAKFGSAFEREVVACAAEKRWPRPIYNDPAVTEALKHEQERLANMKIEIPNIKGVAIQPRAPSSLSSPASLPASTAVPSSIGSGLALPDPAADRMPMRITAEHLKDGPEALRQRLREKE